MSSDAPKTAPPEVHALPAAYAEGFQRVEGVDAPPALETLEVAFGFSSPASRDRSQPLLRFGIFNAQGQLALVCGLRGLVQGSEFSSLVARLGYERRAATAGADGGYDFAYFPGVKEDPTTTRSLLA